MPSNSLGSLGLLQFAHEGLKNASEDIVMDSVGTEDKKRWRGGEAAGSSLSKLLSSMQ